MKILILATPRSGSTTLFNALYKTLNNYKGFCEPFNNESKSLGDPNNEYSLNHNNLLVKILFWDIMHIIPLSNILLLSIISQGFLSFNKLFPYIVNNLISYSSNFDKIILLKRENEIESAKSMAYATSQRSFHSPYTYNNNKFNYSKWLNFIVNSNNIMQHLSQNLKIPLTYYEDLFQNDTLKIQSFLNQNQIEINDFQLFCNMLNSKNRYRQN
jgi:hypothetical protein